MVEVIKVIVADVTSAARGLRKMQECESLMQFQNVESLLIVTTVDTAAEAVESPIGAEITAGAVFDDADISDGFFRKSNTGSGRIPHRFPCLLRRELPPSPDV